MRQSLRDLDLILRGDVTQLSALQAGTLRTRARGLVWILVVLGMFYGACMGCFAVVGGMAGGWKQVLASAVKVPALFFLTLLVTLPSLYVFNALVGSRLTVVSLLRLIVATMGVTLALLASFGTIVAFFSFTTTSYPFMVVLHVAIFAVAGVLGLTFLLRTLQRLSVVPPAPVPSTVPALDPATESAGSVLDGSGDGGRPPGALAPLPPDARAADVRTVFRLWIVVFGLVGAQMSWILRPFIGGGREFALFRPRGSNFFQAVLNHLGSLFGG